MGSPCHQEVQQNVKQLTIPANIKYSGVLKEQKLTQLSL